MEWFFKEFLFSGDYFIWSFLAFVVISFIVGIFKDKLYDLTDGVPFAFQVLICALLACFWPIFLIILIVCLPSMLGGWLGNRIKKVKNAKEKNINLFV